MTLDDPTPRCPVCGQPTLDVRERVERVVWAGRDYGWARRMLEYVHVDGWPPHRVPAGMIFSE